MMLVHCRYHALALNVHLLSHFACHERWTRVKLLICVYVSARVSVRVPTCVPLHQFLRSASWTLWLSPLLPCPLRQHNVDTVSDWQWRARRRERRADRQTAVSGACLSHRWMDRLADGQWEARRAVIGCCPQGGDVVFSRHFWSPDCHTNTLLLIFISSQSTFISFSYSSLLNSQQFINNDAICLLWLLVCDVSILFNRHHLCTLIDSCQTCLVIIIALKQMSWHIKTADRKWSS